MSEQRRWNLCYINHKMHQFSCVVSNGVRKNRIFSFALVGITRLRLCFSFIFHYMYLIYHSVYTVCTLNLMCRMVLNWKKILSKRPKDERKKNERRLASSVLENWNCISDELAMSRCYVLNNKYMCYVQNPVCVCVCVASILCGFYCIPCNVRLL